MSDSSQSVGKNMWDFAAEDTASTPESKTTDVAKAENTTPPADTSAEDDELNLIAKLFEEPASPKPALDTQASAPASPSVQIDPDSDETIPAFLERGIDDRPDIPVIPVASRGRGLGGLVVAVIAVVAIGATALFYTQGSRTATGGPTPRVAATAQVTEPTVSPKAPEQAVVTRVAYSPTLARFDDTLKSDSPFLNGKTLTELVAATATVSPGSAIPTVEWKATDCSSCHTWTRDRLCEQGKWYKQHGDAALDRHGHPYGGDFKRSLLSWAKQGCQ